MQVGPHRRDLDKALRYLRDIVAEEDMRQV